MPNILPKATSVTVATELPPRDRERRDANSAHAPNASHTLTALLIWIGAAKLDDLPPRERAAALVVLRRNFPRKKRHRAHQYTERFT